MQGTLKHIIKHKVTLVCHWLHDFTLSGIVCSYPKRSRKYEIWKLWDCLWRSLFSLTCFTGFGRCIAPCPAICDWVLVNHVKRIVLKCIQIIVFIDLFRILGTELCISFAENVKWDYLGSNLKYTYTLCNHIVTCVSFNA